MSFQFFHLTGRNSPIGQNRPNSCVPWYKIPPTERQDGVRGKVQSSVLNFPPLLAYGTKLTLVVNQQSHFFRVVFPAIYLGKLVSTYREKCALISQDNINQFIFGAS